MDTSANTITTMGIIANEVYDDKIKDTDGNDLLIGGECNDYLDGDHLSNFASQFTSHNFLGACLPIFGENTSLDGHRMPQRNYQSDELR